MKKKLALLLIFICSVCAFASESRTTAVNVIEITDATLDRVYYHQINFPVPTKIVFTNLTSVEGSVYFHQNINLVEVDFPLLEQTGQFYFYGNTSLQTVVAPHLNTVHNYLSFHGNTSLTTLNVCGLQQILPANGNETSLYYHIANNTPAVDAVPFCFSMGGPENLSLSGNSVPENDQLDKLVGTLTADSNYPNGTLVYSLDEFELDNRFFKIVGNQLLTNSTFDFEVKHQYTIRVKVENQLGEEIFSEFTINITDEANETIATIVITDTTLERISYHQVSFEVPTKIVFANLTSVNDNVYFHQNVNLVEVAFPMLEQVAGVFYFHGNLSLETVVAPHLNTVHNYLYFHGNTSLTTLDVCGLKQILPNDIYYSSTYYHISANTPGVDATPFCFSLGGPENLVLSNNSVAENEPINTVVGILSASSNYPEGTLVYSLEEYESDNNHFKIIGNQLITKSIFDFETDNQYLVKVKVENQLGEEIVSEFTVNVTNVAVENVTTIEITDATLDNVYYHQQNFSGPTRLVFTNLTSVSGYVYFHQNMNLVSVSFPLLTQTGRYFYANGNNSLLSINAPSLNTIHDYLYVGSNMVLEDLNVCNLQHILPSQTDIEAYYYISNNPNLDFDTTCLEHTTIGFIEAPVIILQPAPNTLIGNFTSDAGDQVDMTYYFTDEFGNEIVNNDFVIVNDGLYLAHDYNQYLNTDFNIYVGAKRTNPDQGKNDGGPTEKIGLLVNINITDTTLSLTNNNTHNMALFPNPAKDYFEIKSDIQIETATIYDMTGRKLSESKTTGNRVSISDLPRGNYMVVLRTINNQKFNKMIIKE